jgi:hypothetical protein
MPDKQNPALRAPPVSNYSSAIARAVEWLGDRYLLAKPINMTTRHHRQSAMTERQHDVHSL